MKIYYELIRFINVINQLSLNLFKINKIYKKKSVIRFLFLNKTCYRHLSIFIMHTQPYKCFNWQLIYSKGNLCTLVNMYIKAICMLLYV